jgi:hypothetical protein
VTATVLFHFLFEGSFGWEAIGSGEGASDDDPGFRHALADLEVLTGGLPPGVYRAIAASGRSTRWREFRIDERGCIAADEESDDVT